MIDLDLLISEAAAMGVNLTMAQAETLDRYCVQLIETNRHLNLTAITNPREIAVKHLLDSLRLCAMPQLSGTVADVGTGGGFPGVVLAVARPDLQLVLIDATLKKLRFIEDASAKLGLSFKTLHGRAEEIARGPLRENFDTAVARAVAALPALAEYCLPLVRVNGCLIAMKGPEAETELQDADAVIQALGGRVEGLESYALPEFGARCAVIVKKFSHTPSKYPRNSNKILRKSIQMQEF